MYIPPSSKLKFSDLLIDDKIILIGDFTAHSRQCDYINANLTGKEVVNLFYSCPLELVFKDFDTSTFLHYNGILTNTDSFVFLTTLTNAQKEQCLKTMVPVIGKLLLQKSQSPVRTTVRLQEKIMELQKGLLKKCSV